MDLVDRPEDDADVQAARKEMDQRGSAARVLDGIHLPRDAAALYRPKYVAPYHRLVVLAEMGLPGAHPVATRLLDACLDAFFGRDAAAWDDAEQEACLTGNLARVALRMGRGDDPRVRKALAWLVDAQLADGGWHCWPDEDPHGTLDAWEPLAAFAAVPPTRRPPEMREAIMRGVEFLLARRLGVDDSYAPWGRIHLPRHYYYDVLVGLEWATALGDPRDARLQPALDWLLAKRGADGAWRLDAQHPDLADEAAYGFRHGEIITPLVVEETDAPSKWATLAALRVLRRAGRS